MTRSDLLRVVGVPGIREYRTSAAPAHESLVEDIRENREDAWRRHLEDTW